ncbi:MAG: AAA family ATPase [Bacteroidota bacterium]|nr:AAA family ATPase [Bacteroidota bacterium]
MVNKIEVSDFKSLHKFEFEPGRFNVLIGANASGKTNILEAIAMGAAAGANKLDYEFLGNRLRVTSPEFMKSAFEKPDKKKRIFINFEADKKSYTFSLDSNGDDTRNWIDKYRLTKTKEIDSNLDRFFSGDKSFIDESLNATDKDSYYLLMKLIKNNYDDANNSFQSFRNSLFDKIKEEAFSTSEISNFLIYSPEYSFLKKFEEPAQITPLGLKGEGLFYILKRIFSDKDNQAQIETIKEHLFLLDWFDDFKIADNLMSMEYKIAVRDKYLNADINTFDQRSANEGFLFLLFYLVLFTSKNTPAFFAIDNIETGFNPKLCPEITKVLAQLSKKFNKQVIVTTHNPAILDGLNLIDDEQRLFVVNRNKLGHTHAGRVTHKPNSGMKLSEIWSRGYIGGMPNNF